ncbi:hypothetical protein EJB05_28013 [Eragrostis curvula]|uniref:DNA-directed RNA polymerase III subunit RPC5 n=1 Tax=Eragrostis curvula TaxID=38414 RepID=A0A5J9UQ42_9POAL|nr:hypothetical protein EJB05_28013 [Eragrostis curvula]
MPRLQHLAGCGRLLLRPCGAKMGVAGVVGDSPMDALAKMIHDRWGRLISHARVPSPPLLSRTLEPEPERKAEAPVRPLPPEDRDDAIDVHAAGKGGLQEWEEEEDDDFLVRQIDVYFSPKASDDDGKLYLLQYPLKPCWRPYELDEICEEVHFKPLSSKVEIDLNVDTQSENYDQDVSAPLRLTKQLRLGSIIALIIPSYVSALREFSKLLLQICNRVVNDFVNCLIDARKELLQRWFQFNFI